VTALVWPGSTESGPGTLETPFVVSGKVHGRETTVAVAAPDEVLDQIVQWCDEDPRATGGWRLSNAYSTPVTTVARVKSGLMKEARRVAHLFQLLPGVWQGLELTAGCGERMPITDAEWLPLGMGMPCESCLSAAT